MSFFVSVPKSVKKKYQDKCVNDSDIIQYCTPNVPIEEVKYYILTERPKIQEYALQSLIVYLKKQLNNGSFAILSSTIVDLTVIEEKKETLHKLYRNNTSNYKKFIPPKSKILAIGNSIYTITGNKDIHVSYFYNPVPRLHNFYDPKLDSYIWCIDPLTISAQYAVNEIEGILEDEEPPMYVTRNWIGRDCYESEFARSQILHMRRFNYDDPDNYLNKFKFSKNPTLYYLKTKQEVTELLLNYKDIACNMAWDIETSGFHFYKDRVGCISISFDGNSGYYLPFDCVDLVLFNDFLKNKYQILNNGKFDVKFLRKYGVHNARVDFDNLNAGHIINEMRSNTLKTQTFLYTNIGGYEEDLEKYKETFKIKNYLDISDDILYTYATKDAISSFRAYTVMKEELELIDKKFPPKRGNWGVCKYFYDIVMPIIEVYIDMEMQGLYINMESFKDVGKEIYSKIPPLESSIIQKLEKMYNNKKNRNPSIPKFDFSTFNIDSGEQLGSLLHILKWPNLGTVKNKKNVYLTGKEVLEKWAKNPKYKSIVDDILEYRKYKKLYSSNIGEEKELSGFWKYFTYHEDNSVRVHSTFAPMLANSGRNKSRDPNLQNQASHGEISKLIRKMFDTPSKDHLYLSIDYSGLQLRLMAMVSQDPMMKKVFTELSGDMHSLTAVTAILNNKISLDEFLQRKKEEYYANIRFKSKAVNFGLIFLAAPSTIMRTTIEPNWSVEECEEYIENNNLDVIPYKGEDNVFYTVASAIHNNFFETYSTLKESLLDQQKFAQKNKYVQSIYGAIRRLPQLHDVGQEITSDNCRLDENWKRIANLNSISVNSPIQNMEVVVIHRAMIEIHNWFKENNMKSSFFGQIHDAVEIYVHRDEIAEVCSKCKLIMERNYEEYMGIPLEVEGNVADPVLGEVWDNGHDWDKYLKVA